MSVSNDFLEEDNIFLKNPIDSGIRKRKGESFRTSKAIGNTVII